MKIINLFITAILLIATLNSCKKEDYSNNKGKIQLKFDAIAGENDFVMNQNYTNASGETFNVTKFQYYVSNIKFTNIDGSVYNVPTTGTSGYYLVKEKRSIDLVDIPAGYYTSVEFMVGVDSARNTMGTSEREGDLDIGDLKTGGDMYWSWNSGYIFLKFEGVAAAVPDSTAGLWVQDAAGNWSFDETQYTYWNDVFNIHVGGFGGYNSPTPNNNRTISLNLGVLDLRKQDESYAIEINADVLKIMDGKKTHSFTDFYQVHSPAKTGTIANNYQQMFSIKNVVKQ